MIHAAIGTLREAAADVIGALRDFVLTGLIYKLVAFAILTPAAGLLLKLVLWASGRSVLADQEILFFLLSPLGLLASVVLGAVAVGILALDQAALVSVALARIQGNRCRPIVAVRGAMARARTLLGVGARVVGSSLLLAAPFLAVAAAIALRFLTEHDINYYLAERPPEFVGAAVAMGVVLAAGGAVLAYRLLRWALVIPVVVGESPDSRTAITASAMRTAGNLGGIAAAIAGWALTALALGAAPLLVVRLLAALTVDAAGESVTGLLILMSLLLALWVILGLVVSVFTSGLFAAITARLYLSSEPAPALVPSGNDEDALPFLSSGVRVVAALALISIGATVLGTTVLDTVGAPDRALVIAHRGASGEAPENTLAAVALGLEQGADAIEIDVQESADGVVLVVHDEDLMRLGGSPMRIFEASADELRAVDIGSSFSPAFAGQHTPTLAEVLELCRGRARVVIELKYYGHEVRLEERVVEVVERLGMQDEIVTMSLKYDAVQKMKSLRPSWDSGLLTARAVGDLSSTSADFLAVHHAIASRAFLRRAHNAGKDVYVWTINDQANMSRMLSLGVDGLITDYPAEAGSVMAQRANMNPAERLLLSAAFFVGLDPREPAAASDIPDTGNQR